MCFMSDCNKVAVPCSCPAMQAECLRGCPLFMLSGVTWLKAWEGRVHVLYFLPEHTIRELHVQTALSHLGCGVL